MHQAPSIHDFVKNTLPTMGIPTPASLACTLLLQEGRLFAQKYRYEGGYAIWLAGSRAVEFYGEDGTLLKSVAVASPIGEVAASGRRRPGPAA